jgi:hypothetical protein
VYNVNFKPKLHIISVFIEKNMLSIYHQYEVSVFSLYRKVISILSVYSVMITSAFLLLHSQHVYVRDRKRRSHFVCEVDALAP